MCNNLEALQKLIDESLILDGATGLTLTGWTDDENYDRNSVVNRITTPFGIARGGIAINPGSNHGNYGFGGRGHEEKAVPVTLDRVRGVLVTALATSTTAEGMMMASALASLVEKLSSNCFHPVSYDLVLDGVEDPTIGVVMTNGMQTVRMDTKPVEQVAQTIKLDLDVPYVLGQGFVNVMAGENDRGHSSAGLSTLVDGKWIRHTGISSHGIREEEKVSDLSLEVEEVMPLISDERRELTTKILIAIIKQLNTLGGNTIITQVNLSHDEYRGSKPTLVVRLLNTTVKKHYTLEFQV